MTQEVLNPHVDKTVFDGKPSPSAIDPDPSKAVVTDFLKVGDRIYNTANEVETKLVNQDSHIRTIEGENQAMKDELETLRNSNASSTKLEDVLTEVRNLGQVNVNSETTAESLTPEQVSELTRSVLDEERVKDIKRTNMLQIDDELTKTFGDKALEHLERRSGELGITVEAAKVLAESNPEVFRASFNLSKIQPKQPDPSPTHSTINSQAQVPGNDLSVTGVGKEGTYSYLMDKMKSDTKNYSYWNNLLVETARGKGPEFYNT